MKSFQKKVGVFYDGREDVEIVLRDGFGGEFQSCPDDTHCPRIRIGGAYKYWWEVVSVFYHEVFELLLTKAQCRWNNDFRISEDKSDFLFVMDHQQFSNVCARAACLSAKVLPELARAWKKYRKRYK